MGSDRLDVRHRGRDGGKRHHQMMAVCSAPFRLLPRPSGLAVRPEVGACTLAYRCAEINLDSKAHAQYDSRDLSTSRSQTIELAKEFLLECIPHRGVGLGLASCALRVWNTAVQVWYEECHRPAF